MHGYRWTMWVASGRETGVAALPGGRMETLPGEAWIQRFQKGCIVFSPSTPRAIVHNYAWQGWNEVGREGGPLGFPTGDRVVIARGTMQAFQGGGLWGLNGAPAVRRVRRRARRVAGGGRRRGQLRVPDAHTSRTGRAGSTGTFEGGTITA